MLDVLFRRGNPSNDWVRNLGLTLVIDLSPPSINSIGLGAAIDQFSFLGRSTSKGKDPLDFDDLGISLDIDDDGTVSGFQVVFIDPENQFTPFSGTLKVNGAASEPDTVMNQLGEPYWRDEGEDENLVRFDEDEILLFYEFLTHEVVIEQSLEVVKRIGVSKYSTMSDADQRESYGVTKPWPPY